MKKVLLVVALMLSAGVVANAQLKFGVKAGASFTNAGFDDTDMRLGFTTGVFGEFKIAKFAIQPELLLNLQGFKYDYGDDGKGKTDLMYLSIPVMAKYNVVKGLNIEVGPQIGFLLSAKIKPEDDDDIDVKKQMKKTDFALNFGASYELSIIPVGFFARYSLGLTDLYDKDKLGVDSGDFGNNSAIQVGAFIKF